MPMDFPDMKSLISAAEVHKFRAPLPEETEAEFRGALANHVEPIDFIESQEIRTSKGWNRWDDNENKEMVLRGMMNSFKKRG